MLFTVHLEVYLSPSAGIIGPYVELIAPEISTPFLYHDIVPEQPVAVNVVDCPATTGFGFDETTGAGTTQELTSIVIVAGALSQVPVLDWQVAVYVVVANGETGKVEPVPINTVPIYHFTALPDTQFAVKLVLVLFVHKEVPALEVIPVGAAGVPTVTVTSADGV